MQANTTDIFYLTILNSNQTSSLMVSHTSHEGVRGLPERRASGNRRNIENTDCHSDCNDSKIMQSAPKSQGARCANLCVALLAQLMPAHQRRAASGNRRFAPPKSQGARCANLRFALSRLGDLNPGPTHYECVALPLS